LDHAASGSTSTLVIPAISSIFRDGSVAVSCLSKAGRRWRAARGVCS
jgi:hypothetical protein